MSSFIYNKNIYDIKIVKKAIYNFKNVADIAINEENDCYLINVSSSYYDDNYINKELENYIIGLSGKYGF